MSKRIILSRLATYTLWTMATAIAWLAGILNLGVTVRTYVEVARLIPLYLAQG